MSIVIKETLSIQLIGKRRFLIGICLGSSLLILLFLFMSVIRDGVIYVSLDGELLILSGPTLYKSSLLFASVAFVFSWGFTLRFWLSGIEEGGFAQRYRIRAIANNSFFSSWTFIAWFGRIGSVYGLFLLVFSWHRYLEVFNDYFMIFMALTFLLFAHQWNDLVRLYKCKRWIYISLLAFLIVCPALAFIETSNMEQTRNLYMARVHYKNQFVELQVRTAASKGIYFTEDELLDLNYHLAGGGDSRKLWSDLVKGYFHPSEKNLIKFKIHLHNLKYPLYLERFHEPYSIVALIRLLDHPNIHKGEIAQIFEIISIYRDIYDPKMDWTLEEQAKMSINQRIRYEDIYLFNRSWPDNWKRVTAQEILGLEKSDEELIDIPAPEVIELLRVPRDQIVDIITDFSDSARTNPKYQEFVHLLRDR